MINQENLIPVGDPKQWTMGKLEDFGRIRLSEHYFMRDMLYSEVASIQKIPNVPNNPSLAVEVGMRLCNKLLEPLHATFGHVSIRSAFRSVDVNNGGKGYSNIANTKRNYARHVWDELEDKRKVKGATACIVIPWFVDYLERNPETSWWPMAWWIHDHLPYCEMKFFTNAKFKYGAFNLRWSKKPLRRIAGIGRKEGGFPRAGAKSSPGRHSSRYRGFPKLKRPNEHYAE